MKVEEELVCNLSDIQDECDDNDKSTGYMIQRMRDKVAEFNKTHGTDLDPHGTTMKYLEHGKL